MMSTIDLKKIANTANLRIDLHSHTDFSDGGLSVQELLNRAVNFQLDVLAITDHDTIDGVVIAQQIIKDQQLPIILVNGIEISTQWQGFEIHIVGLNLDIENPNLADFIAQQQTHRETRAKAIAKKLSKCGFENTYIAAKALARKGSITRAHFAKALLQRGEIGKLQSAFDKYLGKGKSAYVKPQWCSIADAIRVIHTAGGVAVMAHPIRYKLTTKWLRRLIVDFKDAHGDGLEIVLPQMNTEQRQLMLKFCLEYKLHASMGSDFHYPSRWRELGRHLIMPEQAKPIWQLW